MCVFFLEGVGQGGGGLFVVVDFFVCLFVFFFLFSRKYCLFIFQCNHVACGRDASRNTHNICFHGEIRKNIYLDSPLIWSYTYVTSEGSIRLHTYSLCMCAALLIISLFTFSKSGPLKALIRPCRCAGSSGSLLFKCSLIYGLAPVSSEYIYFL